MKFPKGELYPSSGQRPGCKSRSIKIPTLKRLHTCIFIPNHIFHYIPHYNSPKICDIPAGKIIFVAKSQIAELAISNKFIQKFCVYYSSVINSEILVIIND